MLGNFFLGVTDFWFSLISKIIGVFLDPLFKYLVESNFIPVNFFDIMQDFIFNKFLPSLKFSRDVFINITGLPVDFFVILGLLLAALLSLSFTFIVIKALLNVYFFIRGGQRLGVFKSK